jgi:hypothetical protein
MKLAETILSLSNPNTMVFSKTVDKLTKLTHPGSSADRRYFAGYHLSAMRQFLKYV